MFKNRKNIGFIGILSILLIFITLILINKIPKNEIEAKSQEKGNLSSAVLYSGQDLMWKDTYSHLDQSLVMNLSVDSININDEEPDFSLYDIIYLDSSIIDSPNADKIKKPLIEFTKNGGGLFLENQFWDFFDRDFIGAGEFVKLETIPESIKFPETEPDLKYIQEIIQDFDYIYKDYIHHDSLSTYDYGYGIIDSKGEVLAVDNEIALYTINKVGKGYVFFTNPLLPNVFNINGFSMKSTNELQNFFANTTASANQMIRNSFAAFISKTKYGFSIERIFGSYGRPSIAWQLHYEELTGFENNSAKIFAELCEDNLQIPSFTIIRNSYIWFKRHETISYLLNESPDKFLYSMDEYENAYSSGKHIVADGKFLEIESIEKGGSYFKDYPEYDFRASPFTMDYNKDGLLDIFSGSSNGRFYYFQGDKMGTNYETLAPILLKDSKGKILNVEGYSTPILTYIDNDSNIDLISGSSDGRIHWFSGNGDMTFDYKGILLESNIKGQIMPTIGDINNDGIEDLIIGSNEKKIEIYYGKKDGGSLSFFPATDININGLDNIDGDWLAPQIIDIDKTGANDLLLGTHHGYIAIFTKDGNNYDFSGYMEGKEKNYKGNNYLKFGNNSMPSFNDINGDGKLDLIVGSLEYGLAYPIDSEYFPYKDQLSEQIQYMNDRNYYVGMHLYTNIGASKEYEKNELEMHFSSLKKYGVNTDTMGFNQHTWHTSAEDETQTFVNASESGLLWCSGFKPPRSSAVPESSAETAINIPFYLENDNPNKLLVFNTSTMLYDKKGWGDISAKYDLPASLYYHCDFAYEKLEQSLNNVKKVKDFVDKHDYNFVTEKQFAKGIAASYNTEVYVDIEYNNNKLVGIKLTPKIKDKTNPLYDEDFQKSVGVKIVLSEKYTDKSFNSTSKVWYQENNTIYTGIGELTNISIDDKESFHINRANLPIEVNYLDKGAEVNFLQGGMMQIEIKGNAITDDSSWTITKSLNRDATIFTKFGQADNIKIISTK